MYVRRTLSNSDVFSGLHIAPSSSPQSVAISAITSTGFLVSWSAPPTADQNGNIRSYLINVTEEDTGDSVEFRSNARSVRVESRHPFYNYTCVVVAVTVAAGPFSTPVTVATLEDGMIDVARIRYPRQTSESTSTLFRSPSILVSRAS